MGRLAHIWMHRWIERHFQGALSARRERSLRRHLACCGECRALFNTLSLTEGAGAAASRARHDRLEAALFGGRKDRPNRGYQKTNDHGWSRWLVPASATGALALMLVVLTSPGDLGLRSKGSAGATRDQQVSVTIYSHQGERYTPVKESVAKRDTLAFAYSNLATQGFDGLLLFGMDENYTVYWYYPTWTDPSTNPRAHPILPHQSARELPDEVTHTYETTQLRVFALFTKRSKITVQQIERSAQGLKRQRIPLAQIKRFPLKGSGQHTLLLKIKEPNR